MRSPSLWSSALLVLLCLGSASAERYQLTRVPVGEAPQAVMALPEGALVAVTGEQRVVLVGGAPPRVLDSLDLGAEPWMFARDGQRDQVLVAHPGGVTALRVEGDRLVRVAHAEMDLVGPLAAAYDPVSDALYLSDVIVSVPVDPPDRIHTVPASDLSAADWEVAPEQVWNFAVDSRYGRLYMPSVATGVLSVLDTVSGEVEELVPGPSSLPRQGLFDVAVSELLDRVYTINYRANALDFFEASSNRWLGGVGTAPAPWSVEVVGDKVYLGFRGDERAAVAVGVHDALTLQPLAAVDMVAPPDLLAGDALRERLFAASGSGGYLAVVDTVADSLVDAIRVGNAPAGLALAPSGRTAYVTLYEDGVLAILGAGADPELSTVTAVPETLPADGNTTSLVTVVPRDDTGELLGPGQQVAIETTAGTLLGSVEDHGDGSYTQQLQASRESETAVVSASVGATLLASRPHVVYAISGNPQVRTAQPDWGYSAGGELVEIQGSNLAPPQTNLLDDKERVQVFFDRTPAEILSMAPERILCKAPAHPIGAVDVSVVRQRELEPPRSGSLRGGYTYVEQAVSQLLAHKRAPEQLTLSWSAPVGLPVRVEASSEPDFSSSLVSASTLDRQLVEPPEPQPGGSITYFRVELD